MFWGIMSAMGIRVILHLRDWMKNRALSFDTIAGMSDYLTTSSDVPRMSDYVTTDTNIPRERTAQPVIPASTQPHVSDPRMADYLARNFPRMGDYVTAPKKNKAPNSRFGDPIGDLLAANGIRDTRRL